MIDAEAMASAQRLVQGIEPGTDSLPVSMFAQTGLHGDFLKLKETRRFRREQHFTSGAHSVDDTGPDILARARRRIEELLACCHRPTISPDREQALGEFARHEAGKAGLRTLPSIDA